MQASFLLGLAALSFCAVGCAAPSDRYEAADRLLGFAGQQWEAREGQVAENVMFGLFVSTDDAREADIECTRWGNENADPSQFAVHTHEGHSVERFSLGEASATTQVTQ